MKDVPGDSRALIAVDLGAESCRVSLLQWKHGVPAIQLVHRFQNAPRSVGDALSGSLYWDLAAIEAGVKLGIERCAQIATEGVRALAVDGWAVDYVRYGADGQPLEDPHCYRDLRTMAAEESLHGVVLPDRLRELTAIQPMRINTLYQLHADRLQGYAAGEGWLNLPEYVLFRLGGRPVSERTNAAHTQLVDAARECWSEEIFEAGGLDLTSAPPLVAPGTRVGWLSGPLAQLPGLERVALIAPACHDTASAIAGIPAHGDDWAYISSGTWSLVGTLVDKPVNGPEACEAGFTNLAGAGGKTCFHVNVNGMWMLKQCMTQWETAGRTWEIGELVAAAERLPAPAALFFVDQPDLLLPGDMLGRINAQLVRGGHAGLDRSPAAAPAFAGLIFHSLAARYREVLEQAAELTGKHFKRLFVVGGGSRNQFLNRLVAKATGLELQCGSPESSTLGNFAIQLAALENEAPEADAIAGWAEKLDGAAITSA